MGEYMGLLYCACVLPSSASSVYEEFCRALDPASSPASLLVTHLAVMEARVDCIVFLISQLHVACPDLALHNVQLMQLLVSWEDAAADRGLPPAAGGRPRLGDGRAVGLLADRGRTQTETENSAQSFTFRSV